jgi:hypothetical protein
MRLRDDADQSIEKSRTVGSNASPTPAPSQPVTDAG